MTTAPIAQLLKQARALSATLPPDQCWQKISRELLHPGIPFAVHRQLFQQVYAHWDAERCGPPPAWIPTPQEIRGSHIAQLMQEVGVASYEALHRWSVTNRSDFWQRMIARLGIVCAQPSTGVVDLAGGVTAPRWLPGARLNIVASCFQAAEDATAILFQREDDVTLHTMTYGALRRLSNRVAHGLAEAGFVPGDRVAIDLPMTAEAVAIYLGAIMAGCPVVGIADSFAAEEIATRLRLGKAKGIFTQEAILRAGKRIPLYDKIVQADAPRAIVLPSGEHLSVTLRDGDMPWERFVSANVTCTTVIGHPHDPVNILFSSGTTGDPKAIPWNHTTPIKCAADAYLHHDIHAGDLLAWPTSLGWMMGPWLIYAALINRATIALHYGHPTGRAFPTFVQDAKVTMLGVVPSLVKAWRQSEALHGLDWSAIRAFSSTGECSNADDMLYLMAAAGYKPVIEYCGGTEIGGGFVTGTVVQPAAPATFSTAALGIDLVVLDEQGAPTRNGEVFLVPPSIGLSVELLNGDHQQVYYADTPAGPHGAGLRRHGDQMERLAAGYLRAHGRADDTMNLGGIKVGSAEIERVVNTVAGVHETAAVAVTPPGGGPSLLVIYVVMASATKFCKAELLTAMQRAVKERLNPLFRIHDLVDISTLPRTASDKVMRRVLRAEYTTHQAR